MSRRPGISRIGDMTDLLVDAPANDRAQHIEPFGGDVDLAVP
jgi:hypothetical protein